MTCGYQLPSEAMVPTSGEWISRFANELGIDPPSNEEINSLLGLAGVAAHASERTAAPVTCRLAARAGVEPAAALAIGEQLAEELEPKKA